MPPKIFSIPSGVVTVYVDRETGKLATADCPDKKLEVFVAGTEPTEYCAAHGGDPEQPAAKGGTPEKRSWWKTIKRWLTD
ncbi:penicillin-binding protein 1a [Paenibacillus sp. P1XP2]|nr:penicillin-binding protein 1a [Paenibacillus sp. P1XP2]